MNSWSSNIERIPDSSGNYIICLQKGKILPKIDLEASYKTFKGFEVVYTGIASKSLKKRDYKQHFNGNAGSSTLRKSLGSLFGYTKIKRDKNPHSKKTKFDAEDEAKLSQWMQTNLVLFYTENSAPNCLEDELIEKYNPPLNLAKNKNEINQEFRALLSTLRKTKNQKR